MRSACASTASVAGKGLRYVRIPLHVSEIEELIRMGLLVEDQRYDAEALQAVALNLVRQALDEARDILLPRPHRRERGRYA
jgi:hypothetical protein